MFRSGGVVWFRRQTALGILNLFGSNRPGLWQLETCLAPQGITIQSRGPLCIGLGGGIRRVLSA